MPNWSRNRLRAVLVSNAGRERIGVTVSDGVPSGVPSGVTSLWATPGIVLVLNNQSSCEGESRRRTNPEMEQ
jgi:hypothetical protein